MDNLDSTSSIPRRTVVRVLLTSLFVASAAVIFGFDNGQIGGFMAMIPFLKDYGYYDEKAHSYNIKAGVQNAITLLLVTGAILASLTSGFIGSRFGTRAGLFCCGVTGLVGSILQFASTHIAALYVGRLLLGAATGYASNFGPVYNAEISPAELRGITIGLFQTMLSVGGLVGSAINTGTSTLTTRWAYRIPLLTQMVFPVILATLIWLFPESPRWLLSVNRPEAASRSLRRLRGSRYPEERISREIGTIAAYVELGKHAAESTSVRDAFRGTDQRRTHIACGLLFFQAFSGITFISVYGTYFFAISGVEDAFSASLILQACSLAAMMCVFPSLRYIGRRTILLCGGTVMSVAMLIVAAVGTTTPNNPVASKILVAFTCIWNFFYTWSWGSVGWVVTAEIPSTVLRARTQGLATIMGWSSTLVINAVAPYLINPDEANLGMKVGFIFGGLSSCAVLWAYFFVPETKDRELEELDEMFMKGIPVKNFKSYVCEGLPQQDKISIHGNPKKDVIKGLVETIERA